MAAAATGMVTTLSALIAMRLFIGVAEAIVIPATYRYLSNNFAETQKGTALGIFRLASTMNKGAVLSLSALVTPMQ